MQKIQNKKASEITEIVQKFILSQKRVFCFFLGKKRPVFLEKYLDATQNKTDRTLRLRLFFLWLELIKSADSYTQKNEKWGISYELRRRISEKDTLVVHIREELEQKDKKLFLISTYESHQ
jgi:hypothetical protein